MTEIIVGVLPFFFDEPDLWRDLEAAGITAHDLRGAVGPNHPRFVDRLKTAAGILLGNTTPVEAAFFDAAPNLEFVVKMGVGVDNIDLDEATRRGIPIYNAPGANTAAVADYTVGMILALARKIPLADSVIRAGEWRKIKGLEITGKTLGVVGLGAIGQAVIHRMRGFDLSVLGYDPCFPDDFARRYNVARVELAELLGRADVVTLHLPLTPQTRHLIGREELALMKPEAMLVNTARGGLIDEAALYQALAAGRPAGAALDAYEIEPPGDSPLLGLDNLLHSPHTAWFTAEALSRMNRRSAEQLIEIHQGRRPDNLVNPEAFGVGR